jgi:hypothetical protein
VQKINSFFCALAQPALDGDIALSYVKCFQKYACFRRCWRFHIVELLTIKRRSQRQFSLQIEFSLHISGNRRIGSARFLATARETIAEILLCLSTFGSESFLKETV